METSKTKIILISFIVAVVGLGVGFYAGQQIESKKTDAKIKSGQDNMLKEIFPDEIIQGNAKSDFSNGKILNIAADKKSIIVEIENFPAEHKIKTVLIDSGAKIISVAGNNTVDNRFLSKDMSISDLKIGDRISLIFNNEGVNILLDSQIKALGIVILNNLQQSSLVSTSTSQ